MYEHMGAFARQARNSAGADLAGEGQGMYCCPPPGSCINLHRCCKAGLNKEGTVIYKGRDGSSGIYLGDLACVCSRVCTVFIFFLVLI